MFKPRQDYILVRPIVRKQSDVLEVISHEKHCRGEIIAVGPGKFTKKGIFVPLVSKPGQIVIFGNGDFDFYPKYYEDGQVYRIIQEADIAGVIEDDGFAEFTQEMWDAVKVNPKINLYSEKL